MIPSRHVASTPSPFDAVLFDLDGTIADCFEDIEAAVNHGMRLLGLPEHPLAVVRGFVGHGLGRLVDRAVGDRPELAAAAEPIIRAHYAAHSGERARLYPGMRRLLEDLDRAGVARGVVSNKPHDLAIQALDDLDVLPLCGVVLGEDPAIARKPAPDMLLAVLGRLGVAPGRRVAMVGDGLPDLEAARSAGLTAIGVTWGMSDAATLSARQPDHLVMDATQLAAILLGWAEGEPHPGDASTMTSRA